MNRSVNYFPDRAPFVRRPTFPTGALPVNPPPPGWPRISSAIFYDDGAKAIDWLCRAFGFTVRLKVEGDDGRIEHSELELGEGLIMVGSTRRTDRPGRGHCTSPQTLGGANTQSLCVCIDDVDGHCAKARAAGATIATAPATQDYGAEYGADRIYEAIDLEGHHWWFMRNVRDPSPPVKHA